MRLANKINKSFSLDRELVEQLERTQGTLSASERVNALLKIALEVEQDRTLEDEAQRFFASAGKDPGRKAFHDATLRSLAREE